MKLDDEKLAKLQGKLGDNIDCPAVLQEDPMSGLLNLDVYVSSSNNMKQSNSAGEV